MPGRPKRRRRLAEQGHVELWRGKPPIPGKEPFPVENTLSLLHGLYSQRVRGPIERDFAKALREAMSQGLGRAYSPTLDEHAIRRAARYLATIEIVEAQIDAGGIESLSERVLNDYDKAQRRAEKAFETLGMTPAARAKLGVDVARATDLIASLERHRHLRDRDE